MCTHRKIWIFKNLLSKRHFEKKISRKRLTFLQSGRYRYNSREFDFNTVQKYGAPPAFYERTDRKCRKIDQCWHFSVYNFLCKHRIGEFYQWKLFISLRRSVCYRCWPDFMPLSDFRILEYDIRYSVNNPHPSSETSIFGFPILDYAVWTHFQENNFWAIPSLSQKCAVFLYIEWLI